MTIFGEGWGVEDKVLNWCRVGTILLSGYSHEQAERVLELEYFAVIVKPN